MYKPLILYGAFVSSVKTVKLLLVPLPWTGILISGFAVPSKTLVPKTASPNSAGGLIVPKLKLLAGCGTLVLPKSYLICNSGVTIPSAETETLT